MATNWDEMVRVLDQIERMNPVWQVREDIKSEPHWIKKGLSYTSPDNINVEIQSYILSRWGTTDEHKCSVTITQFSQQLSEPVVLYSRILDKYKDAENHKFIENYLEKKVREIQYAEVLRQQQEYAPQLQKYLADERAKEPVKQEMINKFWGNDPTIAQQINYNNQVAAQKETRRIGQPESPIQIKQREFFQAVQGELRKFTLYADSVKKTNSAISVEPNSDYSGVKIKSRERELSILRNYKKWWIDVELKRGNSKKKKHFPVHGLTEAEMGKMMAWVIGKNDRYSGHGALLYVIVIFSFFAFWLLVGFLSWYFKNH
jgi:hypothetical protein